MTVWILSSAKGLAVAIAITAAVYVLGTAGWPSRPLVVLLLLLGTAAGVLDGGEVRWPLGLAALNLVVARSLGYRPAVLRDIVFFESAQIR